MTTASVPGSSDRRVVLLLQAALTLVLALPSVHGLVRGGGASALRVLGLPPWLHAGILVAELLGVLLLWPRRTAVVGAWLLAGVILVAGAIHVAARQFPLEYVLYLAVVYAVVRLRPRPAN